MTFLHSDNGITIYNGRVFICGQIFLFLIVQLIRAASCIPTFLEAVGIVSWSGGRVEKDNLGCRAVRKVQTGYEWCFETQTQCCQNMYNHTSWWFYIMFLSQTFHLRAPIGILTPFRGGFCFISDYFRRRKKTTNLSVWGNGPNFCVNSTLAMSLIIGCFASYVSTRYPYVLTSHWIYFDFYILSKLTFPS